MRRWIHVRAPGCALLTLAALLAASACERDAERSDSPRFADARALEVAFVEVSDHVSDSVVSLQVVVEEEVTPLEKLLEELPFDVPVPPSAEGDAPDTRLRYGDASGIVVRGDGYILTTYHAVADAKVIEVRLDDGSVYEADLVGVDTDTDLAVVRIPADGLDPVTFADSSEVRPGEWVLALGAPYGLDSTVTAGVVSAVGRANLGINSIEDYLQTDASINPGNSGGPLVNLEGRVVGINSMIVGQASGIGFAVPSNLARTVAQDLIENGEVIRSWIGVTFEPVTAGLARELEMEGAGGALIHDVAPGGPADRAGLLSGDVVLALDGEPLADGRDLLRRILPANPGTEVELSILRSGDRLQRRVVTEPRPSAEETARDLPTGLDGGLGHPSDGPMCDPTDPETT